MAKLDKQCMYCGRVYEGRRTGQVPGLYPAIMSTGICPSCEKRQNRLAKSAGWPAANRAMLSFHKNLFPLELGKRRMKKPPRPRAGRRRHRR